MNDNHTPESEELQEYKAALKESCDSNARYNAENIRLEKKVDRLKDMLKGFRAAFRHEYKLKIESENAVKELKAVIEEKDREITKRDTIIKKMSTRLGDDIVSYLNTIEQQKEEIEELKENRQDTAFAFEHFLSEKGIRYCPKKGKWIESKIDFTYDDRYHLWSAFIYYLSRK